MNGVAQPAFELGTESARLRLRPLLIATAVALALGLVALAAVALAGGFDTITTKRVGGGTRVVRVELVDTARGFDVTPDVVTVDPRTHLILQVVNDGDEVHDLALNGGATRTRMLAPGQSQRLDVGTVRNDIEAWCTVSEHRLFGMTVEIRVTHTAAAESS